MKINKLKQIIENELKILKEQGAGPRPTGPVSTMGITGGTSGAGGVTSMGTSPGQTMGMGGSTRRGTRGSTRGLKASDPACGERIANLFMPGFRKSGLINEGEKWDKFKEKLKNRWHHFWDHVSDGEHDGDCPV